MKHEPGGDWRSTLEKDALRILSTPPDFGPEYDVQVLALVKPSFDDWRAYGVARVDGDSPARGQLVIWRRTVDPQSEAETLGRSLHERSLRPTIDVFQMELPASAIHALEERITSARVPPHSLDGRMGLDGTSFELRFGEGFLTSSFRWWESPPDEWRPLEHTLRDVQALIDGAIRCA